MKLSKIFTVTAMAGAVWLSTAASAMATELTVWCWDDNFNVPAARMAGERYTKNHPDVTVKVESFAQDDIIQKLNAALGAGNVRSLPDVVLIEDYRVKNFTEGYPDFLKDLNGIIDYNNFVNYKVAASSTGDHHYGVPFDSGVTALFVRIDLFEKAGYTMDDLQNLTWDKFIEMGKKVKEVTGVPLITYDPSDLGEIRIMMQSAGAWYTDKDDTNKVIIKDNAALKKGFETLKKLNDAGLLQPYSGWNQFLATFQGDKVSAVVSGCWLTPSFEIDKKHAGQWRIVQIPKLDVEGGTQYSSLGGSQWYVNNYSKDADAAAQFLKETFGSDKELINALVPRIGLITTMKGTENLENYQKPNEYFGGQEVAKTFVEWNSSIPPVNYGQHTKAIDSVIQEALQRVFGGEDIDAVLSDAQEMAQMQIGI